MTRFTWGLAAAMVCVSAGLAQAEPRGGGRSHDEGRDTEVREGNQDRGREGNQDHLRDGNQDRGRDNAIQTQRGDGGGNFGRADSLDGPRNNEQQSNMRPGNFPGRGFNGGHLGEFDAGRAGELNRFQTMPVDGAAAGAAAANRNAPQFWGAQGAAAANRYPYAIGGAGFYNPAWYGAHPNAWAPAAWAVGTAWQPVDWITVASACGYVGIAPASNGDDMSFNQASELAANGASADASRGGEWLPLGIFALVRDGQQQPQFVVQLAINRQGVLRGNSTDAAADQTWLVRGAVDPKSLLAAWSVGDDGQSVMEASLADLVRGEAQAMLYRSGATERWLLVRMTQP